MNYEEFSMTYKRLYASATNAETILAWQVYQNAKENLNNFCLLGNLSALNPIIGNDVEKIITKLGGLKEEQKLLVVFKKVEGTEKEIDFANFCITDHTQPGNVLREEGWTIGINDAWLFGGAEESHTFNFVSQEALKKGDLEMFIRKYIVNPGDPAHPTRVTAREILGLICADYTPKLDFGALVFDKNDTSKVIPDLHTYHTNIENFKDDLEMVIRNYLSPVL